jgi:DNA-binding CsgD family transcriptional regulator
LVHWHFQKGCALLGTRWIVCTKKQQERAVLKDLISAVPPLLDDLYEHATTPGHWPGFLEKFARLFRTDTATIRLTDLNDPVVYQSFTAGFRQSINQVYETAAVEKDPFRKILTTSPLGKALVSTSVLSDRDFERSDHYQNIFRPNGNFYALGTQFERRGDQGMHIGVHRSRHKGAFTRDERSILELFSPHLRRACSLARLMRDLNQALGDARHALNQLPFGVWHTDDKLGVYWMNSTAEEAMATNAYGLGLIGNHLNVVSGDRLNALRTMARRIAEKKSRTETLKLDQTGACLVMTRARQTNDGFHIGRSLNPGILCFLLDPERRSGLDRNRLITLYHLTPAEYRLANVLVCGLDVNEASALLKISPHTGRTQLKSLMSKAGVNRQASLQRKLLLCAGALRNHDE